MLTRTRTVCSRSPSRTANPAQTPPSTLRLVERVTGRWGTPRMGSGEARGDVMAVDPSGIWLQSGTTQASRTLRGNPEGSVFDQGLPRWILLMAGFSLLT